ncbi:MAG: LPS export ABC transporter permease LptG [Pseudomonadales bacterium]|jgi:lipopolysaccharide export system permease protein|nr:LPS export ABC transporter permease LptG [Pseudomonadales bacterium]
MTKLDRYIARSVIGATLVVLLILSGLDLLFTLLDELGDTNEHYTLFDALEFVLLRLPAHLYEVLPMAGLIGALTGLGVLASSNELVVMQASGVSNLRIVWAVMKPALLLMLLGLVLGQWVVPHSEIRAVVNRASANGNVAGLSRYGHWERDGNTFMHFNTIEPQGILYGVSLFEFDAQRQLLRTVAAERAVYTGEAQAGAPNWVLEQGRERLFTRSDGSDSSGASISAEHRQFAALPWRVDLTPDLLQVLIITPDDMAISDLYRYAERFSRQGQNADGYFLSFWKKLLQPLATAALVFVGISFIFGPLREATMGSRLFTAIAFGLGFGIVQRLLQSMSLVYHVAPLPAVLLPILLCGGFGWLLFRRAA